MGFRRCVRYMHASRFCSRAKKVFALFLAKKSAQRGCRAPGFASPLPRPYSLPCALHTSTRVQSTLDTHAPRVRASPAMHMLYAATRAHVKKLGCRARVTGHWLPVGRLAADTSGAHTALQTRSPSPLPATMRHRHAVHAIHHRRCHRTQRHDDNERDEDERHDEEDQGHDGRRERVRAARACTALAQRRTRNLLHTDATRDTC